MRKKNKETIESKRELKTEENQRSVIVVVFVLIFVVSFSFFVREAFSFLYHHNLPL